MMEIILEIQKGLRWTLSVVRERTFFSETFETKTAAMIEQERLRKMYEAEGFRVIIKENSYFPSGKVAAVSYLLNESLHRLNGPAFSLYHPNGEVIIQEYW